MAAVQAVGGVDSGDAVIMTAAEYSESVYQWLLQAYQWHSLAAGFPAYMAYQASFHGSQHPQSGTASQPNSTESNQRAGPRNENQPNESTPSPLVWREFRIAPLWKRFSAEVIDFAILFLLKLIVTFIAVDWFEVMDLDRYDKGLLLAATANGDLDFMTAMEVTSDILVLESIHKILVCIFEALCTHRGTRSRCGGATPGKLLMGIRIYCFEQIVAMGENGVVQIAPASDLGILRASIRAVMKNIASTFIFPSWLTIFLSPHYRAIHDVMSKTIVLEAPESDNENGPGVAAEQRN